MAKTKDRMLNYLDPVTLTISAGQTVSSPAQLFGCSGLGLYLPVMTGTQLTFQVSYDGITYYQLNDPSALSPTAIAINNDTASGAFPLYAPYFVAWRWMKVVSNIAEASERSLLLAPYDV